MEKYGFNGDVILVPGSVRQIQALQGGSIHFAQVDAATAINAINQGADLVMISGSLNSFLIALWCKRRSANPKIWSERRLVFSPWRGYRDSNDSRAQGVERAASIGHDLSRR